jgi:outer membrane protein OmpA-like peptidoglycan-associated protein
VKTLARRLRLVAPLAALMMVVPLLAAAAQSPPGPWDSETERAAEDAVARLGAKRALDIRPVVLTIVRNDVAVSGSGTGVVANVQEVRQAMQSLGAKETGLEVRVELPADVLFDFDKADIRPDAAQALHQLATLVRAYPKGTARLEGHTDSVGVAAYNQTLSERRAAAVKRWLVEREQIEAKRLSTKGFGASRPVATNRTDEGRQKNRRVEVVIKKGS